MDVLGLIAATVVTKESCCFATDPQVINRFDNDRNIAQQVLPLTDDRLGQVTPVDELDVQPIAEGSDPVPDEPQNLNETPKNGASDLESPQFSPTVVLEGEAVFGLSDVAGKEVDEPLVFQSSVELKVNASFTGKDTLEIGLESGNRREFSFVGERTFEGRLSFPGSTDRFELSELSYQFPIGDRASVYISTAGNDLDDLNPFLGGGNEGTAASISEFGEENPIHRLVGDVGLQFDYDFTDELSISLGYFSDEGNEPRSGGLFNGNKSAFAQLKFEPSERFLVGFTYIYTYNNSSLETETGSGRSQINLESPVIGNSYGISASFAFSDKLAIGGWVGLTKANVIDLGSADIWNYALTLAFPNLGKKGNLLGIVIGQEPRLTRTSGFLIDGQSRDRDLSLHLETFYSARIGDRITIAPGLIWITAPNHDNSNPDIFVFTVRTTFEF
ncbi:MAG: iron uptake porin [Cyanosarcina radialis HA8281-LM2]|jgi:hypothetical protein|nr:iron uptake porin [Cyanosarcina radialis HA8281-LM2]